MKLTFKPLREGAIIPHAQTKTSAGLDLHVCTEKPITIAPGEIKTLYSGVALCPEREDVVIFVIIRSSLGRLHGLTLSNSVGVIDSDYRGEIMVPIINNSSEPYTFMPGERFAQLVVCPVIFPEIEVADELPDSERGDKGFGSTGKL